MQTRHKEYNTPVSSWELNQAVQGLFPKGRYYGFETISNAGGVGINIALNHTNGLSRVNHSPTAIEANPFGVVVTPMGQVIQTDDTITLPVTNNAHLTYDRIDYIVMTHEYQQVTGGSAAVFSILQGTPAANPVGPTLPNPEKQVLIASYKIAANSNSYSGISEYTISETPIFANKDLGLDTNLIATFARLNYSNKYTKSETHESKALDTGDIVSQELTIGEGRYFDFNSFPAGTNTLKSIIKPTEGEGRIITIEASLRNPLHITYGASSPSVGFAPIVYAGVNAIPGGGGNVYWKLTEPVTLKYDGASWLVMHAANDNDNQYRLFHEGWADITSSMTVSVNGTGGNTGLTHTLKVYLKKIGNATGDHAPFYGQVSTNNGGRTFLFQIQGQINIPNGTSGTIVTLSFTQSYFNSRRDQVVPFVSDTNMGGSGGYLGKAKFKAGLQTVEISCATPSTSLNGGSFEIYLSAPIEAHATSGS